MLIAMANAAANSPRANLILDPYPSIVDPENPHRLAMDPKVLKISTVLLKYTAITVDVGQRVQCCKTGIGSSCYIPRKLTGMYWASYFCHTVYIVAGITCTFGGWV